MSDPKSFSENPFFTTVAVAGPGDVTGVVVVGGGMVVVVLVVLVVLVVVDVDVAVDVDRVVEVVVDPCLVVEDVVDPGWVVDGVLVVGTPSVVVVSGFVTVQRAARASRASVSCWVCTKRVRAFRLLWLRKNFARFAAIVARKRASVCCRVAFCAREHVAAALCGVSAYAAATPTTASAHAATRPRPPL